MNDIEYIHHSYRRKEFAMKIVRYTADLIDDVIRFENELRKEEPMYDWQLDDTYVDDVLLSFKEQGDNALSYLAIWKGNVVGRIDAGIVHSHFDGIPKAYLDWVCVLPSYRHKGVGKALMNALTKELQEREIDTIVGIAAGNPEAKSYYHAMENAMFQDEGVFIELDNMEI